VCRALNQDFEYDSQGELNNDSFEDLSNRSFLEEPRSSISVETWDVERLINAWLGTRSEQIYRPSFQRGLVWSEEKRSNLIRSIMARYPIGSILLSKRGNANGQTIFEVVDGLQRSHSLLNYRKTMFSTITTNDIPDERVEGIVRIFLSNFEQLENDKRTAAMESVKRDIVRWFKYIGGRRDINNLRSDFNPTHYNGSELKRFLLEQQKREETYYRKRTPEEIRSGDTLDGHCANIVDKVRTRLDIDRYQIPTIIYEGPKSLLPEIFKRLNTGGVMLNKYDIMASSWDRKTTQVSDPELISAIKSRINVFRRLDGYEATESNLDFDPHKIQVYDFVCGIGSRLSARYKNYFTQPKKSASMPEPLSHGFTLTSLALGLDIRQDTDWDDLPTRLNTFAATGGDFYQLLNQAVESVVQSLDPIIQTRIEDSTKRPVLKELQIASYVSAMFWHLRATNATSQSTTQLQKYIRQHMLYDTFRKYWGNAGDSKAYNAVKEDLYNKPVSARDFRNEATIWFRTTLQPVKHYTNRFDPLESFFLAAYCAAVGLEPNPAKHLYEFVLENTFGINRWTPSNIEINSNKTRILPYFRSIEQPKTKRDAEVYFEQRFQFMLDRIVQSFGFM
jgi:Protein of unknown function DUF262